FESSREWPLRRATQAARVNVSRVGLQEYSLVFVRQGENIQRISGCRSVKVGRERRRDLPRTASAISRRNCYVLFAVNAERNGKALHGCCEPSLPQDFTVTHIDRSEMAIEIPHKRDSACGRYNRSQKGSALFNRPHFIERLYVIRCQFSQVAL